MQTTGVNRDCKSGALFLARVSAAVALLCAVFMRLLVAPQARHYYLGLVEAWHVPVGYSTAVVLACTVGLGCGVCSLAATWDYCTSPLVGGRPLGRIVETAVILLAVAFTTATCAPPLVQWLLWML